MCLARGVMARLDRAIQALLSDGTTAIDRSLAGPLVDGRVNPWIKSRNGQDSSVVATDFRGTKVNSVKLRK